MQSHCCDKSLMKRNATRSHTFYHTSQGNNSSSSYSCICWMKEGLCKSIMVLSLKDMCKNSISEHIPKITKTQWKHADAILLNPRFGWVWNISPVVACMGVVGWWVDASSPTLVVSSPSLKLVFLGGRWAKKPLNILGSNIVSCPF